MLVQAGVLSFTSCKFMSLNSAMSTALITINFCYLNIIIKPGYAKKVEALLESDGKSTIRILLNLLSMLQ